MENYEMEKNSCIFYHFDDEITCDLFINYLKHAI